MNERIDRLEKLIGRQEKQTKLIEESNQRAIVAFEEVMFFRKHMDEKMEEFKEIERKINKVLREPWYKKYWIIPWILIIFMFYIGVIM